MKYKDILAAPLDFFGFSASFLCALHCLALPFLLTMSGLSSLQFLDHPWLEGSIILLSILLALASLLPSCRKHKKPQALLLMSAGFVLIALSQALLSPFWESLISPAGALLVAAAHYVNWKMLKKYHYHP